MTIRMGTRRLHTAELIEFLSHNHRLATEAGPLPPKVAEALGNLQASIGRLEAMHKTNPSSLITDELVELDEERDELYIGLLASCRAFAWHNDKTLVGHGAALVHAIENYGSGAELTNKPYSDESASIQSLLTDLARPELRASIEATGAGLWIEPLRAANERFRERFLARNEESASKEFALTMKQQRAECFKAYDQFIDILNAAEIMGESGLATLSGKLNALTETQRAVLAQRRGRAAASKADAPAGN